MIGPARYSFGQTVAWPVAITIPARNEARRIRRALDAAAASLRGRGGIVVVVNGSHDATLDLTCAWFAASGVNGIVLDDPDPPEFGGVGYARQQAIHAALGCLAEDGVVMTTDADGRVAADWVDANIAELSGADLICGAVQPDRAEFAALPSAIAQRGAIEGDYMALTLLAERRLDPVLHDPAPSHRNAAGASLAFRRDLYLDVGEMPIISTGEDRLFAARAEARDWRIRHSDTARVTVACRLYGRTSGGMAGALRSRITDADPLVDEILAPARITLLRAQMRGVVRREMAGRGFGLAWAKLRNNPMLTYDRMRLSDLSRELPLLEQGLAAMSADRDRITA